MVDGKLNVSRQRHLASRWVSRDLGASNTAWRRVLPLHTGAVSATNTMCSGPVEEEHQIIRVCLEKGDQDDERF